mmetsp:Transcript_61172/g.163691  ORF Transcript_61172/g.163691 Transcript_61172/m.163691 type:complete len:186 (-) Transcript_61172:131-688(-)
MSHTPMEGPAETYASDSEDTSEAFLQPDAPQSRPWRAALKIGSALLSVGVVLTLVSATQLRATDVQTEYQHANLEKHHELGRPLFLSTVQDAEVTFNCNDGYAQWRRGWSFKKKSYCCMNFGRGCQTKVRIAWVCAGIIGSLLLASGIVFLVVTCCKQRREVAALQKYTREREESGGCLQCLSPK